MVSFDDLSTFSSITDSNEFFIHYFNKEARFRYDSNYFHLLFTPSIKEFELIEEMHKQFSHNNGLDHMKFRWPDNQGVLTDTMRYLNNQQYGLEKLELYSFDPKDFVSVSISASIQVKPVNKALLPTFKGINYTQDELISSYFAEEKQPFYDTIFQQPSVSFFMAYYNKKPAGSVIIIESKKTIEIDDLFTIPNYRHKGIATALQQKVWQIAEEKGKTVILAADAEDTPREMYRKLGYNYEGFQIGALKELKRDD